ncbi:MAG: hypothetical protein ACYTG2_10305 [Planctomycetota bacterium]|jgi:hypothetical protein
MKTITKQQAVETLKTRMLELVDEDHSMCEVASRYGIFCHGFGQWTFDELKQRYWWLADRRPGITRAELERLANIWQVARQQVMGTDLSCDTQTAEHDTCHGWDQWEEPTLARYVFELCGEQVKVVPDEGG